MSLTSRVGASLTAFPGLEGWRRLLFELAWLAPTLGLLGWFGDFVAPAPIDFGALARVAVIALLVPALAEEVVFRAALLPAPSEKPSLLRCSSSVLAFVVWHPVQVLWFGDAWGATVLNPWFLAAVAAFGVAATRIYLVTASLWPSVFLHWLIVVAWKVLGGASPWS